MISPLFTRRRLVKAAVTAAACSQLPAFAAPKGEKSLRFYNLHTGETTHSTFWVNGQFVADELKVINRLLRDHRAEESTDMDTALLLRLHELHALLDSKDAFHVISAYRSPTTNAKLAAMGRQVAKRSYHMSGQAIDIRLPDIDLKQLHKAALAMNSGGVGNYPSSNFVHIDTGRTRSWG